jgi:hypothetical protein
MRKQTHLRTACIALLLATVFFGCYKWKSYSQPTEALPSQVFHATLSIQPGDDPDNNYADESNADFGLFGVLLPDGWTIDEDEFEFTFNCTDETRTRNIWVYANEAQAARLQELNPAPKGYHWWGGQTEDKVNMFGFKTMDMNIPILPTAEVGDYELMYTVGDLGDPTHPGKREPAYIKTPKMPIKITPDAKPTSLTKAVLAGVSIYPTAAQGTVNIDINTPGATSARIVAMNGNTVLSQKLITTHNVLDVAELKAGNYFVVVESGNNVKSQKIQIK